MTSGHLRQQTPVRNRLCYWVDRALRAEKDNKSSYSNRRDLVPSIPRNREVPVAQWSNARLQLPDEVHGSTTGAPTPQVPHYVDVPRRSTMISSKWVLTLSATSLEKASTVRMRVSRKDLAFLRTVTRAPDLNCIKNETTNRVNSEKTRFHIA